MNPLALLFANRYVAGAVLALIAAGGGWLWHHRVAAEALNAAQSAGYQRRAAEDEQVIARQVEKDRIDAEQREAKSKVIIDDLHQQIAVHAQALADARDKFSHLRVCSDPIAGPTGPGAVPAAGSGSQGDDHRPADRVGELPSLEVAGAELYNCEHVGDVYNALKAWVLVRHPIQQ
jgi:hypothetical protein